MSKPTSQELDRWVVDHLICAAARHGFTLTKAYDGEEFEKCTTKAQAMDVVLSVDESRIYFKHPDQPRSHCAVIVMGNDGWDAIADNSVGPGWDDVMAECDEYANSLEEMYGA